jgi:glycosyltransferase involved in cell wall biosynthesis
MGSGEGTQGLAMMETPDAMQPTVSVIIPTFRRPELVRRAVRSALSQTLSAIEVIVVLDGPDEATRQALRSADDPRLRIRTLPTHLGPAAARNAGVDEARAPWIAFLDDDDEWLPDKLARQVDTAARSSHRHPIVSCRVLAPRAGAEFFWPRRLPRPKEPLSEYLFCRASPFWGEGLILTSTILTRRELAVDVPFNVSLRRTEDLDWLLRVSAREDVGLEFVRAPGPLVVWHFHDDRARLGNPASGQDTLAWVRANRALFTRRAYAAYLLTGVARSAARRNSRRLLAPLLREACRYGRPSVLHILWFLAIWLIPQRMQRRSATWFARRRRYLD